MLMYLHVEFFYEDIMRTILNWQLAMCLGIFSFGVSRAMDVGSERQFQGLGRNKLHEAALAGDMAAVSKLLNAARGSGNCKVIINAPDFLGRTPLHYAVKSESFDVVSLLLEYGADPNISDSARYGCRSESQRNTPLDLAVKQGSKEIVNELVTNNSTTVQTLKNAFRSGINAREATPKSSLHDGIDSCCFALLKNERLHPETDVAYQDDCELYLAHPSVNYNYQYSVKYPLHDAIQSSDVKLACALATHHSDIINSLDDSGECPVSCAVRHYNYPVAKLLLESGAHVSQELKDKLLWYVGYHKPFEKMYVDKVAGFMESREKLFDLLLNAGADINSHINEESKDTFLHLAVMHCDPQAVAKLVGYGARVDVENAGGFTPLQMAQFLESDEMVQLLEPDTNHNLINFMPVPTRRSSDGHQRMLMGGKRSKRKLSL
jgi:ankyrin repeat protein